MTKLLILSGTVIFLGVKMNKLLFYIVIVFVLNISATEFDITVDSDVRDALPAALTRGANEAYKLNLKGLNAMESGDLDNALSLFTEASEKIPNYSDAENNRGVVYWRKGIVGSAEKIWNELLKKDPKYSIAWYNLAIAASSADKNIQAIQFITNAISYNPRFIEGYALQARIEMDMGEYKNANKTLKLAYEIDKENSTVWQNYAYTSILIGDTSDAEKILNEHSGKGEALRMLGEIHAVRGERKVALDYLKEANSRGVDIDILLEMAQLELDDERPCDAFDLTEMYLEGGRKGSANSYNVGGIAARECGEQKRAEEIFLEGLNYYPEDELLRINTGAYIFHKADYQRAYEILSELPDTVSDPSVNRMVVLSLVKQNKNKLALVKVKDAIKRSPYSAELYDIYGTLLYKSNKKVEAKNAFEKAIKLDPVNKSAKINLSLVEGKTGGKALEDVIMDYNLRLDTCDVSCISLRHKLSRFYALAGNLRRAISLLNTIEYKKKELRTYTLVAHYYNELGRSHDAIAQLEEALDRFDIKDNVMFELASSYISIGAYIKGIKLLDEIKDDDIVGVKKVNYQRGYALMKLGNYKAAAIAFEAVVAEKNPRLEVFSFLGFIYNQLGDMKKAKKNWEKTIKENPNDPIVWINMGLLLDQEGKYKAAIAKYQKALTFPSVDKGVYINIGKSYEKLNLINEAKQAYGKALSTDSKKDALYNLFLLALKDKKSSDMKKYISQLSSVSNNSVEFKRASGEYAVFLKNYQEAARVFETIEKKNLEDYASLAKIYKSLSMPEKMDSVLSKLPEDIKWNRFKRELRSEVAFEKGNFDKAYSILKSQDDTTFIGKYNLALAAYKAEKYDEALSLSLPLIEEATGEDRIKIFRLIGNVSAKLKKWVDAERWFSALSDMSMNDPNALYNIAVACYNLNKIEKSFEYYKKAQKIDPSIKNSDIEKNMIILKIQFLLKRRIVLFLRS